MTLTATGRQSPSARPPGRGRAGRLLDRLARLVPEQDRAVRGPALVGVLLAVVGVPLLAAAVLLRQSGLAAWNTVYAEDGDTFLEQALAGTGGLLEPYAGYAHLVPRVLVELVVLLPPERWSQGLAVASAVVVALLSAHVFVASSGLVRSVLLRGTLAALLPLLPVAGKEGLANLANLHWFLFYACFWALLSRPTTRLGTARNAAVVVLAVLSDPLPLVLAPLLLLHLGPRLAWRERVVPALFVAAGVVQVAVVLGSDRSTQSSAPLEGLLQAVVVRGALGGLTGVDGATALYEAAPRTTPLLAVVVLVVLAAVAARRGGPRALLVAAAGTTGAGLLLLCLAVNWSPVLDPGVSVDLGPASRYSIAPQLLVLTVVVAAAEALAERLRSGAARAAGAVVLLAVLAAPVVADFRTTNDRSAGPSWTSILGPARANCATPGNGPVTRVPITPPGWAVDLECSALR